MDELAPHGNESVEFLVNDELLYHAGDLTVPAWPDSGMDMRRDLRDLDRNQMPMKISQWTRMTTSWKGKKTKRAD